jgi:hypothetical protein
VSWEVLAVKTSPYILKKLIIFVTQTKKTKNLFMKKNLLILAVVAVALLSFVAEKFIVVRMPEEKNESIIGKSLNGVKQIVSQSDLPHRQVVYIVQSIDSLQKDIQASGES